MIPSIHITVHIWTTARKALIAKLHDLVPEAANPYSMFDHRIPEHDPRLAQVFAVLEQAGVHRLPSPPTKEAEDNPRGHYAIDRVHVFSKQECHAAPFLWLRELYHTHRVLTVLRNEQQELLVQDRHGSAKRTLLTDGASLLARERFCPMLDAEGFVGLAYRTCHLCHESSRRDANGRPTYPLRPWKEGKRILEIRPSIDLPPMYEPEIQRRHGRLMYPAGWQGPGEFVNPGYDDCQPFYARTALDSVGPFDLARTWEYRLPLQPDVRTCIVSQRFYRFCLKHMVDGTFIPVHIVDA